MKEQPCLFSHDFNRKVSSFSSAGMKLFIGLMQMYSVKLRKFSPAPIKVSWDVLSWIAVGFCQHIFYIYWYDSINLIVLLYAAHWCDEYITWFLMLNKPWRTRINPTWLSCIILIHYWTQFNNILLRILHQCSWELLFCSFPLIQCLVGIRIILNSYNELGLPRCLSGKESTCQCRSCRRCGSDPWVGKISWRRKQQPTPVFLPE